MAVKRGLPCRFHGGLSTGPKTVDGKMRALRNFACYRDMPDDELRQIAIRTLDKRHTVVPRRVRVTRFHTQT
jgi:hypothetical protein